MTCHFEHEPRLFAFPASSRTVERFHANPARSTVTPDPSISSRSPGATTVVASISSTINGPCAIVPGRSVARGTTGHSTAPVAPISVSSQLPACRRRNIRPGFAPVHSPPRQICLPLTMTW